MNNDDAPTGRILTRREAVELLGLTGAGLLAGWKISAYGLVSAANAQSLLTSHAVPILACVVRPEATEGPYFVDHQLNRSDIRVEPSTGKRSIGMPLTVAFNVSAINGQSCTPLAGATIDVWHCDSEGVYSGVDDMGFDTTGRKFLRGFQTTDANGSAKFVSVYPGWYEGRTVHYHFKIRTKGRDGKAYEFTSQLFFDDTLSDAIFAVAPYKRSAVRDTRNSNDMHFAGIGDQLLLKLDKRATGYAGSFNIGLDLADAVVGKPDGFGIEGRGGPGGRGRGAPPQKRDTGGRGE